MTEPATQASPASPATDARPASPASSPTALLSPAAMPRIFDDDGAPAREVCHRCGYPLIGLPRENACPECGQPAVAGLVVAYFGDPPSDPLTWLRRDGRWAWLTASALVLSGLALWLHPLFWIVNVLVIVVAAGLAISVYRGDHPLSEQLRFNDAGLLLVRSKEPSVWDEFLGLAIASAIVAWLVVSGNAARVGALIGVCMVWALRLLDVTFHRYWPVPAQLRSLRDPEHRSSRPAAWSSQQVEAVHRTNGGAALTVRTGVPLLRRLAWHDRIIEIPCSDRDADFLVKLIEHHVKQHARASASPASPAE